MESRLTSARQKNLAQLHKLAEFLPGIVTGIFISRVIGERVGVPGWGAAALMSLTLGAFVGWLTSRRPLRLTWPGLIPAIYIVYPEPDPAFVIWIVLITILAMGLNWYSTRVDLPDVIRPYPLLLAGIIGFLFFALYLRTLAPDVLAADSGELQIVTAQLGVAHPPGFPLYVMVAHLFTRLLPFVSPAYAVNLFSAVTGALTVAVVYATVVFVSRRQLPAIIAAIALGTATTFWSQATTANVRSLTGLFTALILYALIRFRSAVADGDRASADRWLIWVALFMGFGMAHHVSLIFLIAIGLLFILIVDPAIRREPRRWARPAAAAMLGFLPLIYLPLRAAADVRGASPDLATWSGFVEHVLATGFRGDLFYYVNPADFIQRLRVMANVMTFQFAMPVLLGMIVGVIFTIRRDRALALLLGGSFAIFLLVAATYRAPQTVEYMVPAYIAGAMILGCGLGFMTDESRRFGRFGNALAVLLVAVIMAGGLGQTLVNWMSSGAEHESISAREYAAPLLEVAPDNAVILAHWHWATPLWYLQEIEGIRPDVEIQFVYPEGESYEVTWENRLRDNLDGGRPVITTWVPPGRLADLPVPEPIGEALLFTQFPREELPADFTATQFSLGDAIEVVGYQIESSDGRPSPGEELVITVAWRPVKQADAYSMFVHLVGQDGVQYGQDDLGTSPAEGITLTQFRVTPRPGTPIGPSSVVIGVNGDQVSREEMAVIDITLADRLPWTSHKTSRSLLDGSAMTLVGYDWDHTVAGRSRLYLHWQHGDRGFSTQVLDGGESEPAALPPYRGPWGVPVNQWRFPRGQNSGHYVPLGRGIVWTGETIDGVTLSPGQNVVLDQALQSGRPLNRDYVVSVRLIGLEDDGVHWNWWDLNDSIPAMGGIPTLKWIKGSFVRSPHRVTVAENAWPGQALTGALTFYDAFTNRPIPILDERLTSVNPWIPLGQGEVIPAR